MSDSHHQDILRNIEALYREVSQAFAEQDIEKALSFFADHPDMIKISNGHVSRGKKELLGYWNQRLGSAHDLQIEIKNIEMHIIDEQHVWATADEYISINGEVQKAIVSNLFLLGDSGWKILHDHTTYVDEEAH
jgi:ketosteroid isomerase-like protein